ncbi:hypothetical protein M231_03400 [Tremella mesenterica]|uniref:Ig-like domain-containing protein n=1 Tax=Tremella mesenterica TaxID=5217 RepID=A0A4Q1BN95_TREME|nr:hypothetical protein M231_03400 [Tremella mesenterica]
MAAVMWTLIFLVAKFALGSPLVDPSTCACPRSSSIPALPSCTPSSGVIVVEVSAFTSAHVKQGSQELWISPDKATSTGAQIVEYNSCDEPMQLDITTWPFSESPYTNTSKYSDTVHCLITGSPAFQTATLSLFEAKKPWQWDLDTGTKKDSGLNVTCESDGGTTSLSAAAAAATAPVSCPEYNLTYNIISNYTAVQVWNSGLVLSSTNDGNTGPNKVNETRSCIDMYIHYTVYTYAKWLDRGENKPKSTVDCILKGDLTDDCEIMIDGQGTKFPSSHPCLESNCTKGGPPYSS